MTTAYTSLLGFALPVTGELSGTWGDTVNDGITKLLDSAIAGTTTITTDADVTLSTTTGASNTSRQAIILWNPTGPTPPYNTTRTITAPAQSKIYTVINASSGTQSIILAGVGPTTGVTIAKGESALVAWNGSDFIKISNTAGPGTFTDLTVTGNTTLGNAVSDTITVNSQFVTGTVLRSAQALTNTLALAAYDVDGTAYTNLITLTAANEPTLALTSTGVGTINNMSIGATTASTGAFTTLSATGVATFSAGTAALPAITTTGDTNTGIWFPAADTIAFTEGGVESMRIDASGNLLVGNTTGTGYRLNVNAAFSSGLAGAYIEAGEFNQSVMVLNHTNASVASNLFQVQKSGTGVLTLDSSGNLGLGVTPNITSLGGTYSLLAVGKASGSGIIMGQTDLTAANSTAAQFLGKTTGASGYQLLGGMLVQTDGSSTTNAVGRLTFYTATGGSLSERMRLDSSGNLGIGTTSPTSRLHVKGTDVKLTFETDTGATAYIQQLSASPYDVSFFNQNAGSLIFGTNNTGVGRFDASGNLIVGDTSTGRRFKTKFDSNTVYSASDFETTSLQCYIANTSSTIGAYTGIQFAVGNNGDAAISAIRTADGESALTFGTRGGGSRLERARIDSSGNVGIGTTTPASYGALAVRKGVNGTWIGVSGNSSFQTSDATNSSLYVVHSSANSGTTFIGTDADGRLQMFCSASATGGVYLANAGTSWTSASDERVKENLAPIQNGLEKVTSLRAVTGNYINDESKKSRAFLIAQDVQAVLPEAVDHSNPDELGLSYTDVIPLLVASIQEMKALIDTQASTITQLQADVAALKGA